MLSTSQRNSNAKAQDSIELEPYRQLGKGRNSEVVFAFDTVSGDQAAVKILNKR